MYVDSSRLLFVEAEQGRGGGKTRKRLGQRKKPSVEVRKSVPGVRTLLRPHSPLI